MAITSYLYEILTEVVKKKDIDSEKIKSIFEIGEQNFYEWFGKESEEKLKKTIKEFATEKNKGVLKEELEKIISFGILNPDAFDKVAFTFDVAKIFYKAIFNFEEYKAIDFHGTKSSIKFDLNEEYKDLKQYDLVTNIGSSEHIFNQLTVFKTIHNLTKSGGIIIHQLPGQGYYNHGFYNYQPTFFFDLAHANNYLMIGFWIFDNNKNKIVNIGNRKNYLNLFDRDNHPTYYDNIVIYKISETKNEKFKIPFQNIYSEEFSESNKTEELDKWMKNRK